MTGASQDLVARDTEELMDLAGAIYDTVLDRTTYLFNVLGAISVRENRREL